MRPIITLIPLIVAFITSYESSVSHPSEQPEIFCYEQSVVINRPILSVWEYMFNVENCTDYLLFLKSASKKPDGPYCSNTELTLQFGFLFKKYTNCYKVVEYNPPYNLSYESVDGSAVKSTGTIIMDAIDSSSTKLTVRCNPKVSGFFTFLSDEKVDKIYNKTIGRILLKVKNNLE